MAVGWSSPPDPAPEPATPTTSYILVGVGVDPAGPGSLAVAWAELEPVPYAEPEDLHDDAIPPTAVYRKTGVIYYDVHTG